SDGIDHFGATAVVNSQTENHAGVAPAHANVFVDVAKDRGGQIVATTNGGKANVLLHDLRTLIHQILAEQGHQEIQLRLRPLPILDAQAVERQLFDAQPTAFFHGGAYALNAALVPLDTRQTALPGPPAVAIHDDRDVSR